MPKLPLCKKGGCHRERKTAFFLTGNGVSFVVGVEGGTGRLRVLESADRADPIKSVTYTIRIEDLFVSGGTDDADGYGIIDFGEG